MGEQLPLDFGDAKRASAAIIRGAPNESAFEALEAVTLRAGVAAEQARGHAGMLFISGPPRSGKSSMARLICEKLAALRIDQSKDIGSRIASEAQDVVVIDDISRFLVEKSDARLLFHLFNHIATYGSGLVIFDRASPGELDCRLPDLASRLESIEHRHLEMPDDALCTKLVARHFHDLGVIIPPRAISILARKVERSYESIEAAAREIDALARASGRRLSEAVIREYLAGKGI